MTETTESPTISQKIRVLLVDDHSVLRQGMAAMINEEPDLHVCGEADGVRSALEVAEQTHPDVALVDLSIRDGDGLELIKEMKRRFPQTRTLVLSMFDESVYAERALRAGARGYIMKAEAAKSVMTGIRSVLRGEVYLSHDMAAKVSDVPPDETRSSRSGAERLSDRELQILRFVGRGMSTREIAEELFLSVKTVEAHREHIKEKLNLVSSGELLRYAIEHNRLHSQ